MMTLRRRYPRDFSPCVCSTQPQLIDYRNDGWSDPFPGQVISEPLLLEAFGACLPRVAFLDKQGRNRRRPSMNVPDLVLQVPSGRLGESRGDQGNQELLPGTDLVNVSLLPNSRFPLTSQSNKRNLEGSIFGWLFFSSLLFAEILKMIQIVQMIELIQMIQIKLMIQIMQMIQMIQMTLWGQFLDGFVIVLGQFCRQFWDTFRIRLGYFWDTFKILFWKIWDTFGIPLIYFWNTFGIILVYVYNTFWILCRFLLETLDFFLDLFWILLEYFLDIFGILLG